MKAQAKATIAMFGGATALAVAVGFGGVAVCPVGGSATTTTHPSTSVTPAGPEVGTPAGHAGVHPATLIGCIPGANC